MKSQAFIHMSTLPVRTACPICAHQEIELELGCDLEQGVCIYAARCRSCHAVHEIAMADPAREMNFSFHQLRCTECGREGAHAHLHCELDMRRFFHSVHCDYCCKHQEN